MFSKIFYLQLRQDPDKDENVKMTVSKCDEYEM